MEQDLQEWVLLPDGDKVTATLPRVLMLQQRQGDPDILAPVMPRALVVLRVPVGAVVLAAASGQALAGVEATGQALAGVELPLHGEAGSVMKC